MNTTHATVSRIINRYHEYNTIENLPRPGRPSISKERNERSLIRIVKKNRKLSSNDLTRKWQEASDVVASARTIRRVLQKHNYVWRAACKKPRLSKKNQKAKNWCLVYKIWSKSMWQNVLFNHEMNVEVESRKNRVMLRRTPHEKMYPDCSMYGTKQGSGSIGIWACMIYEGVGCFKLFDGRLDSQRYLDILTNI